MTLIALHLIQNHAPSNLNRDDNGDPKDSLFGGVRRARISSQAIKRSIRWSQVFRDYFANTPALLAMRTQLLPELVKERLATQNLPNDVRVAIVQKAAALGKGEGRPAEPVEGAEGEADERKRSRRGKRDEAAPAERVKTAQLMFLTDTEIDQLTEQLVALVNERDLAAFNDLGADKLLAALDRYEPHAADIAMFGRMTTSSPFKNVEAAVQVAHAISTHAVEQEFDYYTAVDDVSGEAGAGFIGETSFNSATYYKYLSIDWPALVKNTQGDHAIAATTVRALIHAALFAIPSGKQNSFAAHNLPDLVLVEVREQKVPLSYANAFVRPVRPTAQRSLVEASAQALQDYIPQINDMYDLKAERAFLSTVPFELKGAQRFTTLTDLLAWLPMSA